MSDTTYSETSHQRLSLRLGLAIIFGVTLWRVVMLIFNRTDLFVDEAQYWFWGQNLDFGYYSKPPIIAWVIRFFNAISGSNSTFWIRVSAPLFHLATALMLMRTTRRLIVGDVGREIEPWVGVIFVTLPAASLSAVLVSTDTIQILFVTIAIWAFLGLTKRSSIIEALILGVSLGIAFLTKYSVLFLLPGVGVAMLTLRSARIAWRDVIIAAIAGAIVVAPNLWWNFAHDAATVRHTESIAHWNGDGNGGGLVKHLLGALGFVGAQFGVVGPIIFYAMLWAAWRMIRGQERRQGEAAGLAVDPGRGADHAAGAVCQGLCQLGGHRLCRRHHPRRLAALPPNKKGPGYFADHRLRRCLPVAGPDRLCL